MESSLNNTDLSALNSLSTAEKQELTRFLEQEQQKAVLQERIHQLTDKCFPKCVSSVRSATLDSTEQGCVQNCVQRFLDAKTLTIKHLESLQKTA